MELVREIAFVNAGAMDPADFAFAVEAIRIQVMRDFLPAWQDYLPVKRPFEVVGYTDSRDLAPGSFAPIAIVRDLDTPGVLGDHGGLEASDSAWGRSLPEPTVMSHEALELAGDPFTNRWVPMPNGSVVALEVADPCENDRYIIRATVGGQSRDVEVSNFVHPPWFGEGVGQLDHMGRCKAPGDYDNGYVVVREADGTVLNLFGALATPEYSARVAAKLARARSRTARRHLRTPA